MDTRTQRRRLRRIERALELTDPEWVMMMRGRPGQVRASSQLSCAVILAVLGTAAVVTGAATAVFPLIFAGVLVLVVAACMYVSASSRKRGRQA